MPKLRFAGCGQPLSRPSRQRRGAAALLSSHRTGSRFCLTLCLCNLVLLLSQVECMDHQPRGGVCRSREARKRGYHRSSASQSTCVARLSECIGHDDLINCGRPLRRCPSRAVAPYRRHRVERSHAASEVFPPHMAHPVEGRDQPHQTLSCTSAGSALAQMQTLPAQTSSPQRSHHRDQAEHWDHTRAATRVRSVALWSAMTGPANPCRALQRLPRGVRPAPVS